MRVYTHRCVSPTLPDDRRPGWMPARAGLASSTIVFKRSRTSAPRFQPSQSSGTSACGMTSRSLVSISTNSRAMSSPTAESAGAISCQRCCRSVRPFAEQYATRLSSRWANCFVSVTSTQFGSSRATSALAYRSSWSWPNSESSFDSTRTYSWRCAEASPRRPRRRVRAACSPSDPSCARRQAMVRQRLPRHVRRILCRRRADRPSADQRECNGEASDASTADHGLSLTPTPHLLGSPSRRSLGRSGGTSRALAVLLLLLLNG
jgi:hypothetical protein